MRTDALLSHAKPRQFSFLKLSEMDLKKVRDHAREVFQCGRYSLHGQTHWQRVEAIGLDLARQTGADQAVVQLFSILHDCCRQDDGRDPQHGPRAADMLASLVGTLLTIDADRLCVLEQAIRYHADGQTSDDPTIGTCWDADRLDLGRTGKRPDEAYMSTEPGKRRAQRG